MAAGWTWRSEEGLGREDMVTPVVDSQERRIH